MKHEATNQESDEKLSTRRLCRPGRVSGGGSVPRRGSQLDQLKENEAFLITKEQARGELSRQKNSKGKGSLLRVVYDDRKKERKSPTRSLLMKEKQRCGGK